MTPEFLRLYDGELSYLREMGAEFAAAYPRVAGRLSLEDGESGDPYVERLLEGVAFLAARVQLKLQARFPDFTQHLLELVYPHFLSPMPSMTVVAFTPDPDAGRMEAGHLIPRQTRLISQTVPGTNTACEFRTASDVHLWPVELRGVEYIERPDRVSALNLPRAQGAQAAIRIRLGTTNQLPLSKLALRELTLHFPSDGGLGGALLRQMLGDCSRIVLRPLARPCPWQEVLPPSALRHRFDAPEDALLPQAPKAFDGYRLLQEYFALPERTLFVQLAGLGDAIRASDDGEIEIIFALRRADARLARRLRRESIRLFATPAINLFEHTADRIRVDDTSPEHHIVPDRVRPLDLELHSVTAVRGEMASGESMPFRSLYSIADRDSSEARGSYTLRRERRALSQRARQGGNRSSYLGSETFLMLGESGALPHETELKQLSVRGRCTNRDLPLMLPLGQGRTDFALEIGAPVLSVRSIALPSRPGASAAEGDVAWKLISHLSLNYLSISDTDGGSGVAALRELLSLYAGDDRIDQSRQIAGIRSVDAAPTIRRIAIDRQAAVVRGLEVTLNVDEAAFEGIGSYPLAAVLARFFARHASINSFAEMVLRTDNEGEVARWPMMPGRTPKL